jgi:hypothetical protein
MSCKNLLELQAALAAAPETTGPPQDARAYCVSRNY